jgi:catechol 2,3-dioxygenase-like lactoylglutathione lyase family enzyme
MTFTFSHDHVGITVTPEDLDTTIAWYSRNLGFAVDQRFESHDTTFVFLTAGDVKIELLAGASDRGGAPADNILMSMDPSRLHHFCLAVTDLGAAVSRLLELDVPLIGGPMEIPEIGQRIAFVTDNVGTIIELTEPGTWPSGRNGRARCRTAQTSPETGCRADTLAARRGDEPASRPSGPGHRRQGHPYILGPDVSRSRATETAPDPDGRAPVIALKHPDALGGAACEAVPSKCWARTG